MTILDRLKIIVPFSYMWILRRMIGDAKTILDLGCGDGRLMEVLSQGKKWKIDGVDIFSQYIEVARQKGIYNRLIKGDLKRVVKRLAIKKEKYDVVFFSQVIEHIPKKEGEAVLRYLERLVGKRIIVGTPRGFMQQPKEFLDSNPHQIHESGWTEEDFRKSGYKIYGVGIKPIWSEGGLARTKGKLPFIFWTLIGYMVSVPVYFFPKLGAGILAVKNKGNR